MNWQVIAIVAPLFFVAYQALSKLLPKDTSVFLLNMYASLMGAGVMLLLYLISSDSRSLTISPKHLPLILGIGALIALGNAAIIKAYGIGAPQSGFTALFYPLLIVYGVIVGFLIWREKITLLQTLGVALILAGIFLVTMLKR